MLIKKICSRNFGRHPNKLHMLLDRLNSPKEFEDSTLEFIDLVKVLIYSVLPKDFCNSEPVGDWEAGIKRLMSN